MVKERYSKSLSIHFAGKFSFALLNSITLPIEEEVKVKWSPGQIRRNIFFILGHTFL